MNKQQEIIETAELAGFTPIATSMHSDVLKNFAKLVADKATDEANARSNAAWALMCKKMVADEREAEREACAKEAEDSDHVVRGRGYHDQLGDADATARNIAAAIRARGEA